MDDIVTYARNESAELVPLEPGPIVMLPDIRDADITSRGRQLQPQTKPNYEHLNHLADILDRLGEGRFSMRIWDGCICGWARHCAGVERDSPTSQVAPMHVAREWLGLTFSEAMQLFIPRLDEYGDVTSQQAAKVIRHYIATNDVDWSVAYMEGVPRKLEHAQPA